MAHGPVLVLGAGGQLGRALLDAAGAAGIPVVGAGRREADVTDPKAVGRLIHAAAPSAVINAAAYTAVDRAEAEPDAAFAVNRDGAANVALACASAGAALVHVSTDYVFDGRAGRPYTEDDPVAPAGVYGASKLAGEEAVTALGPSAHVIVRTAWVFSAYGHNFVRSIWRLAHEREALRVVADQRGSPTPADALGAALLAMARQLAADPALAGLYHFAGTPAATWHDLAAEVVDQARGYGPLTIRGVEAIATSDYPTAAKRPANAVLDTARAERAFGLVPPPWRAGVARAVARLAADGAAVGRVDGAP